MATTKWLAAGDILNRNQHLLVRGGEVGESWEPEGGDGLIWSLGLSGRAHPILPDSHVRPHGQLKGPGMKILLIL
jgi:hypothetical protein